MHCSSSIHECNPRQYTSATHAAARAEAEQTTALSLPLLSALPLRPSLRCAHPQHKEFPKPLATRIFNYFNYYYERKGILDEYEIVSLITGYDPHASRRPPLYAHLPSTTLLRVAGSLPPGGPPPVAHRRGRRCSLRVCGLHGSNAPRFAHAAQHALPNRPLRPQVLDYLVNHSVLRKTCFSALSAEDQTEAFDAFRPIKARSRPRPRLLSRPAPPCAAVCGAAVWRFTPQTATAQRHVTRVRRAATPGRCVCPPRRYGRRVPLRLRLIARSVAARQRCRRAHHPACA